MKKEKTYKLKKINEDQIDSLLENILKDFENHKNWVATIEEIKEIIHKKWVFDVKYFAFDCEKPYLEESFYFRTKKEAIELTKN